jgi:hypothetical protein
VDKHVIIPAVQCFCEADCTTKGFLELIAILLYDKGRTVSMAVNEHQNGTSSLPEVTYGFIGETRLDEHRF